jgi:pyruvate,water dikinase
MFTASPNGNGTALTIVAGYGLGEGVVSGSVETDTYHLGNSGADISSEISPKRTQIRINPNGTGGTRIARVRSEMVDRPVLSESNLLELRKEGAKIHRQYQCPQDIEWGYDCRGRLFIMQARPVTSHPTAAVAAQAYIWDNANIVESYPGLTLPLTFSFIVRNYAKLFRKAACGLTLRKSALYHRTDIWNNMLGLLRGRVYYNLTNWYAMLSYLPGFRHFQKTWDRMIGIAKATPCAPRTLSVADRTYTVSKIICYLLTLRRTARWFFKHYDHALAPYRDRDFSSDDEYEVMSCYRALENDLLDFWHVTLYSDLCAMVYYDLLKHSTEKYCNPDDTGLHHELLRKSHNMESVKPLRSLMYVAQLVRNDTHYRRLFTMTDEDAWRTIQTTSDCALLRDAIKVHLSAYGDRCFDELKLESKTYRDDPVELMRLVRTYADSDVTHLEQFYSTDRENADRTTLRRVVSNPIKRLVLGILVRQARCAITNRENMRFARTPAYGVVRRMFRRLGQLMSKRGLITHQDDIFYLSVDEVFGAIRGTGVTLDLKLLVAQRKSEYAEYAKQELPPRFASGFYPQYEEHTGESCARSSQNRFEGTGCSAGVATGRARVVTDPRTVNDCRDCVLITRTTDPSWVFLMVSAKAIVAERGSVLSHTAIVGRELGIPTVVGVNNASTMIPNDAIVTVDGSSGRVTWK